MPSPEPAFPRLGAAQGLGFLLVALLGLGFQVWLPSVLPADGDYRAAADLLEREARPGDVLLLHPWWTERARLFLPASLPVVGYLGDEADPLVDHPRIWVLAQPRLPRTAEAAFAAGFLPGRTPLGAARRLGPLELTAYRNGRARSVRFSAADALETASASVDLPGQGRVSCTRSGDAFRCPGGARVESSWHEVLYRPVHCLFVVPPGGGGSVEVTFDGVPQAERLRFEAGIVWEHAWKHGSHLTPLEATLLEAGGGAPLAALVVRPGTEGLLSTELPAGPRRLQIRMRSDNPHEREACLVLLAVDPIGEAP